MYCLDTNIIIDLLEGNEKIRNKLEELERQELVTNPIILCELYKGFAHVQSSSKRKQFIELFMQKVKMLEFNEESCRLFGEYYIFLKQNGNMIGESDIMIAAICKAHNTQLITSDKDFLKIKNFTCHIW